MAYAPSNLVGKEILTKNLKSTEGILVAPQHLENRKENSKGTFRQFVPGHGGDVIAVTHKWGIAVYDLREIQFVKKVRLKNSREPRKIKKRRAYIFTPENGSPIKCRSWNDLKKVMPERIKPSQIEMIKLSKPYKL